MADPWEIDSGRVRSGDEIGEGSAGKIGRRDTLADIAAGPGDTALAVEPNRRKPIACHSQHTAPTMRDGDIRELGEHLDQRFDDALMVAGSSLYRRIDPGPEPVGGAPAPECNSTVLGALAVDDQVSIVDQVAGLNTGSATSLRAGCRLLSMRSCSGMALLPLPIRCPDYANIMARCIRLSKGHGAGEIHLEVRLYDRISCMIGNFGVESVGQGLHGRW